MFFYDNMSNKDSFYPKMDIKSYRASLEAAKERRGHHMCAPLKKIRGKSAEELLIAANLTDKVPVPLEPILEYLGIAAVPFDFAEVEETLADVVSQRGNILGMMYSKDDHAGILYRKDDSVNSQRFTIAHELGHCAISNKDVSRRIEFRNDKESIDPTECSANTFAGELLIPERHLRRFYTLATASRVDLLAQAFAVSENVMRARLDDLGLTYE